MLTASIAFSGTSGLLVIGGSSTPGSAAERSAIQFNEGAIGGDRIAGFGFTNVGSYTSGTYKVLLAFRATGSFAFVSSVGWRLMWIESIETILGGLSLCNRSKTNVTIHYMRVPSNSWLPTPLASNSFATWGTTDGMGHAETTGIGSGGSGEAWTDDAGTWAASGTAAASALSGGIAIATVDTGTADVIATVKVTRSAGNAGLVVRYADSSNYVYALHNGTNAQLIKVVAGTPTTLINSAATYSAGAELRVTCDVKKFRLHYNNSAVGAEQTIGDASLASGTKKGLYTTSTSNTFDDFTVYARGTGGEYSALDAF
jgi:hypothetical protein